jgi:hypothetical protein
MTESFRVSPEFHEYVESHRRDDETMEETLRRLVGVPDPDDVAGILSPETADAIEAQLERKRERERTSETR